MYLAKTAEDAFSAAQFVVATGPFQTPSIPPEIDDPDHEIFQIHSADHRDPTQLPQGEVLVVGGWNAGYQIADEPAATRSVTLAIGQRMPSLRQRLLDKDLFWWLSIVGFMKVSTDSRLGRKLATRDVLIGSSARRLKRSGVTMRTRLSKIQGRRAVFDDGGEAEVDAVVWATGYRSDTAWIDVPWIKGPDGRIVHRRGVTDAPGLYFIGLPWQHTRGSALIGLVKDDAAFIARRIESNLEHVAGVAGAHRDGAEEATDGDGSRPGVRDAHRQRRGSGDDRLRRKDVLLLLPDMPRRVRGRSYGVRQVTRTRGSEGRSGRT